MSIFALPAIVRRQLAGSPHPTLEYLAKEEAGWTWKKERVLAFAFPDYGAQGCKCGAQCSEHAECVTRCVGGDPMTVPKEERATLRLINEIEEAELQIRVTRFGVRIPSFAEIEGRIALHLADTAGIPARIIRLGSDDPKVTF